MGSAAKYFQVEAPVERVYAYWRDVLHARRRGGPGNRSDHQPLGRLGLLGKTVEWDAEITEDIPNQRIAWRSVGDADVANAGAVRFDDHGDATGIEVSLEYDPPAGKAGELAAELLKDPDRQVERAVESFRGVVGTGSLRPA
jgi:uncharacterized membrane protein